MLPEQMKEKVLIFNTYFMSKLAPNDQVEALPSSDFEAMANMFDRNYNTVKRVINRIEPTTCLPLSHRYLLLVKQWIKEDIFEKEILVFPLNLPEHWSAIVVRNHKKAFDRV